MLSLHERQCCKLCFVMDNLQITLNEVLMFTVQSFKHSAGKPSTKCQGQACMMPSSAMQGDAFTFGDAEPVPKSAMRRKSVMPRQKDSADSVRKI